MLILYQICISLQRACIWPMVLVTFLVQRSEKDKDTSRRKNPESKEEKCCPRHVLAVHTTFTYTLDTHAKKKAKVKVRSNSVVYVEI